MLEEAEIGILEVLHRDIQKADPTDSIKDELSLGAPDSLASIPLKMEAPNVKLSLEYIYGYRSYDMRNNLFINSNGCIVYNQAQMAINLKADSNS